MAFHARPLQNTMFSEKNSLKCSAVSFSKKSKKTIYRTGTYKWRKKQTGKNNNNNNNNNNNKKKKKQGKKRGRENDIYCFLFSDSFYRPKWKKLTSKLQFLIRLTKRKIHNYEGIALTRKDNTTRPGPFT